MSHIKLRPVSTRVLVLGALLTLAVTFSTQSFAAATLATGADASATLQAGARFRNLAGSGPGGAVEVWVFDGPAAADSTSQLTWAASQTVTLTYVSATDILSATVGTTVISRNVGDLGSLNYV